MEEASNELRSRWATTVDIDWNVGGLFNIVDVAEMKSAHRHLDVELNLITTGTATYVLNGRRYELRRNTLVWLLPGRIHMLLGKSRRFDYWLGLFPISLLRRFCPNSPASMLLQDDPRGCFCRDLSDSSAGRLCSVFDQAIAWRDPSTRDAGLGFALLAAWEEYSTSREHVGQNIHPSVSQAIQIICDEIESIGLDEIAERVDLSAQYLSKLFKEQTGMTLSRFRNKRRIERFLQTTAAGSGRSSVLERALEAGFGSYPQFHRVFSEEMGCTPTQFRTRVRMKRE